MLISDLMVWVSQPSIAYVTVGAFIGWVKDLTTGCYARLKFRWTTPLSAKKGAGGGFELGVRVHYPVAIMYAMGESWLTWQVSFLLGLRRLDIDWLSSQVKD